MADYLKTILAQVVHSPGAKAVKDILVLRVLAALIGIFCSVIIARLLGPENKGIVVSALILPSMLGSIAHFGLPVSNVYYLHKTRSKRTLLVNGCLFSLGIAAICYIFCLLGLDVLRDSYFLGIDQQWIIFLALSVTGLVLLQELFFQFLRGLECYRSAVLSTVLREISRCAIILALVLFAEVNVTTVVVATVLTTFLVDVFLLAILYRQIGPATWRPDYPQFTLS